MTALHDFHFLRPAWLLLLLALPPAWRALGRSAGAARAWAQAVDAHLLPHLLVGAERSLRTPRLLLAACLTLASLALAGPTWERLPAPLYRNQAVHVLALELAATMQSPDLKPDRLARARFKLRDLLRRLGDGQVALIAYAGDAFVVAPLTDDANTVDALLDALDPATMPVAGNAMDKAIERAVDLVHQAGAARGDLLLVADAVGGDALAAAARARQQGVTVSVLGVGTAQGAPVSVPGGGFLKDSAGNIVVPRLDVAALQAVAAAGGGRYASLATDASDLDAVLAAAAPAQAAPPPTTSAATSAAWRDRGPWLVLALLPLALLGFRRGWLLLLALAFLPTAPARAFGWNDLWLRPDQQAWRALQAQQPEQAAQLARDPALRGAAQYRQGDYAAAAADFARGKDAEADYNRGNALAKAQQYEQALAAYDAALAKAPGLADAQANRDAVADWLKQQAKQQKPDQQPSSAGRDGSAARDKQDGSDSSPQSAQSQGADKPQDGEGKDAASGNPSAAGQSSARSTPGQSEADHHAGHDAQTDASTGDSQQQAQQREAAQREAMERALAQPKSDADKKGPAAAAAKTAAAAEETETQREQRQAMEQWLQRVPDDPGGLLRRKFQLEYERRQRQGGQGDH